MGDGTEVDVTDRCHKVWEEWGYAVLFKHNHEGRPYVDRVTGEAAQERITGRFRVELKKTASPAVRAIYEEMRAHGIELVEQIPSWQPIK